MSLLAEVHTTPFDIAVVSPPIKVTDAMIHMTVATATAPQVSDDISCLQSLFELIPFFSLHLHAFIVGSAMR